MNPTRTPQDSAIDRSWALNQIGGDEELFGDIATVFLADSQGLKRQLASDLASGERNAIHQTAHCIKSAVGNFGARHAMAAAQALETAAKDDARSDLPQLTETLLRELNAVEDALRPYAA